MSLCRSAVRLAASRPTISTAAVSPVLLSRSSLLPQSLSSPPPLRSFRPVLHRYQVSNAAPIGGKIKTNTSKTSDVVTAVRVRRSRRFQYLLAVLVVLAILYNVHSPFRHSVLAVVRCARVMKAVVADVWDYKRTFAQEAHLGDANGVLTPEELAQRRAARKACHRRSAQRIFEALKKNSGVYVKLGQHVAAVQVLPKEWTEAMTPLQDQCFPTPIEEIDAMLKDDLGLGIDDLFIDFNPLPIGVASLAQVHRAIDKRTGRPVAVKFQHADLQEFALIDMATVNFAISFVKHVFPDFEFGWLGEEMNEMLPLEMNFRHEAANSMRCRRDFQHLKGKTSLYLPEVLWAERRCLVMEYINGTRVDDLSFLQRHGIDRNQVSKELSRIFSQMVYINGFFHADPHHGNILIRPRAPGSSSPYNFDICLLDHGQYFDIPADLRVNYAHFWLALMRPQSEETTRLRKKYARLVGNIEDDMYPYLESAITGRVSMEDSINENPTSSLLGESDSAAKELDKLRSAVMDRDGLIAGVFELLRRVPRRLLMILKLSDLQRSLDYSLSTTHSAHRIYIIIGQYCTQAVWDADRTRIGLEYGQMGLSLPLIREIVGAWWMYASNSVFFGVLGWGMDVDARWRKMTLWFHGLTHGGLNTASLEVAGLQA
ncbi:putative mitochondrion protein [Cutaneotrichosporon oleaginosum]|uniref:Putative mitochondrion protein n=1 Tax=Cutaneotrichosporon oleaginosum TaxID=879819 RepID=A0A0J0XR18_9TREE|nr:putative mitochondrion protein [Cutaneotrichosporon oleaginosum]KLT43520.1 putative mitochondrion protein [Cutaneotrichosporon oleaginosum]TXT05581.1 hypothetical protein COLE_06901 [Cutaneotrichosporon oleaginosum]